MSSWGGRFLGGGLLVLGLLVAGTASAARYGVYPGCCDASAAAPLNEELFAAASDEGEVLRMYRRGAAGSAVAALDLGTFLAVRGQGEADLEGAARLGNLIFWIGSHGRKPDGRPQSVREVLFATAIRGEGAFARLEAVGRPFRGLITALAAAAPLARFKLQQAAGRPGEAPGGLNIEGLAAGPDGSLWIGFRNPVPDGLALLVPLLNPRAVAVDGQSARLGSPVLLDLGGGGVRDIARAGSRYLIIAGPAEGGGRHRLHVWTGGAAPPEEIGKAVPKNYQAEGIVVDDRPEARSVLLLSDDGNESIGGRRCGDLKDPARRAFRGLEVGF